MPEVVVLGDVNVDVLMSISAYPRSGGDAVAESVVMRAGGSAANTAIVLAKLGASVKMVGRTGQDAWAELALRALHQAGVDVGGVQRDERISTGIFFIPVSRDGERTMFGLRGANARTDPAQVNAEALDGAHVLHVSGYALLESPQRDAAMRAIDLAGRIGIRTSLDTGLQPALTLTQEMRDLLPRLEICVLGMEEAQALVGAETPPQAAQALVSRGTGLVGLKLGAQGCVLARSERLQAVPPFDVAVVDTTGAGDAFSAGLIFGYLRGLSLPATGTLATALGALATTAWGGGSALPGRDEVRAFLADRRRTVSAQRASWIDEVLPVCDTRRGHP